MNPFNREPLTSGELEQDCLCFLTPYKKQVKSSRLFMGHFHEVWAEKLAKFFNDSTDNFKNVRKDEYLIKSLIAEFGGKSEFFLHGKAGFEESLLTVDLGIFKNYEEAYAKLMIDLTVLCVEAIRLVLPKNDETETLYITGGFARNEIFIYLIKNHFRGKKVKLSEIDNSSALGAAMVIADTFSDSDISKLDLGLIE